MATINAASTSLAHVQAAIDAASTGDTVVVPAGSSTWTGDVAVPDEKQLSLIADGVGSTVITSAAETIVINIGKSNSRVSGWQLNGGSIRTTGGSSWRIDHSRFYSADTFYSGVVVFGDYSENPQHPNGLVDNCTFYNTRVLVEGTGAMMGEREDQNVLWAEDFAYGSASYVYVEDCNFLLTVFGNCIDGNYGGRYVFRYNTVQDAYLEMHSVQGDNRAGRRWEVYENVFSAVDVDVWVPMFIRGGTGVIFNNTLVNFNAGIALNNVRDTEDREVCGQCDGTSSWDQNTASLAGYACRDQIGRGRDTTQWVIGEAFTQTLEPAYIWGNVDGNDDPVVPFVHGPSTPNHIVEDRDYYLSEKSGYTPYTYPHPLQGSVEVQTMYVSCWA